HHREGEFAMTTLVPMPAEDFASFESESTSGYAQDNLRSGRWPASTCVERARAEFHRLLPEGLATPGHFIYNIHDEAQHENVGFIWLAETDNDGVRTGHVYNIVIRPDRRGRGHATAALRLIEAQGLARGLSAISLHVFSHNAGAQALYRSIGYGITGFNMIKPLQREGA
ncbi:MAG TPA: GNAT family N-acetyltransferase, partial [Albitalea sp.]|nr:GNAT family N-acetyltransferase [Albitalea sp.]